MREQRLQEIRTTIQSQYAQSQYIWVQFIAEHLCDCSKKFEGDLQAMLIMAIIGQSALYRYLEQGDSSKMPAPVLDNISISASSLSEILGIPRETVRRKLEWLRQKGWIEKDESASWRLVIAQGEAMARRDLMELDRRGMDRLAGVVYRIMAMAPDPVEALARDHVAAAPRP